MIDMNNLNDTQRMFIQGAYEIVINSTNVKGIINRAKDNPMNEKSLEDIINAELDKALVKLMTKSTLLMTDYNEKESAIELLKERHIERLGK